MKKNTLTFVFWLGWLFVNSQDIRQNLIVVHIDPSAKTQFKQRIFSYKFLNGSFVGTEELLSVPGRREGKDYIRIDIGRSTIYKNRYLITGIGNIIDLVEKKVLVDGRAQLIKCENDSAVFYTNDIFKGKFYSVYDFKKQEYSEVKDLLFKPRLGKDVEFDKTTTPFKINYYPQGGAKVTVCEDAGYGQIGTKGGHVPDPPIYWIDNNTFIYPKFNKENTEVSFYKIGITLKESMLLGKVAIAPEAIPSEIYKLGEHQALMSLGARQILIDVKEKTVTELQLLNRGHDFSYECKPGPKGRAIQWKGQEIGRLHFNPMNFVTDTNIAALVKEINVGSESYQQGIAVWHADHKTWASVDADEILRVVGWVNE